MIDVYTKCSRCGEMFEGEFQGDKPVFEAVQFRRVSRSGITFGAIDRNDEAEQRAFRQEHQLCPNCLADTLDFVRGEYQPPKQESESPLCPWCHEPMVGSRFDGAEKPFYVYNCTGCGASCSHDLAQVRIEPKEIQ